MTLTFTLIGSFLLTYFTKINFRVLLISLLLLVIAFAFYGYYFPTSNESIIGHLLPFSDASGYFTGGTRFYNGHFLDSWSSRRPWYSIFISGLLTLTNGSFDLFLLIQICLNLVAIYFSSLFVNQYYGKRAACLFVVLVLIFYSRFLHMTLTEGLGFALALFSLIYFLDFIHKKSFFDGCMFLLVLSLGLNVRAGSFFVLPFCLIFGSFEFIKDKKKMVLFFLLGGLCILTPFILTFILSRGLSNSNTIPMSNFAHTLFGLVNGGKGWSFIFEAHPEILKLSETELNKEIYSLAFDSFLSNPLNIIKGAIVAYSDFFYPTGKGMFGFLVYGIKKPFAFLVYLISSLLVLLFVKSAWNIFKQRNQFQNKMNLAILIGLFCSIPFVFPADADLMRAQACMIPYMCLITGMNFTIENGSSPSEPLRWAKLMPLLYIIIFTTSLVRFFYFPTNQSMSNSYFLPISPLVINNKEDLKAKFENFAYPEITDSLLNSNLDSVQFLTTGTNLSNGYKFWFLLKEPYDQYQRLKCVESKLQVPQIGFNLLECTQMEKH